VRFPSGRYKLGKIERTHQDVSLNAGAPRPFRAPGCPQGAFAEELMLDEIATMAGLDPLALRLKVDTDDDRREMFTLGAELIGWSQRQPTGAQKGIMRRGFGLGSTSWGRNAARTEAEVVINRDGSVEARSGTQDIGTGLRTVLGVSAATVLGVPLHFVNVRVGSSRLPVGPGSGGSVTSPNTAPAMTAAAEDARRQLLQMLAEASGGSAGDLEIKDGQILRQQQPFMTWFDACRRMSGESITGRGRWDREAQQRDTSSGHSHGVQLVELHVDSETGVIRVDRVVAIQACGRAVCRKTAESQIIGGVIQGISYALFEERILDRNFGAMLNPNLEWYKIAGSADMPRIEPILWTKGQTGVRSLGEPPTIPTAGAIAGALYNALGTPVRRLPLAPPAVLAALAALEGGDA
jgi:xanthine dehydrogenase YagR molybdenum-binding subunit